MCQSCCEGILRKSWRPKCPICQLATSRRQIKEDPKIARISAAVAELARTNEKSIEASHDADEGKQQQAAPHGHHGRKRKQPHSEQSSEEHSAKAGFHEDKENEGGKTTRASQRLQGKEWPCSMCTFVNPSHRRMLSIPCQECSRCRVCGWAKNSDEMSEEGGQRKSNEVEDNESKKSKRGRKGKASKGEETPTRPLQPAKTPISTARSKGASKSAKKASSKRLNEPPVVAMSGVGEMEGEVEDNVVSVGGLIVDDVTAEGGVSHLVVGVDDTGRCKRTFKFLKAMALCIPVVSVEWALDGCPCGLAAIASYTPAGDSVTGDGGPERSLKSVAAPSQALSGWEVSVPDGLHSFDAERLRELVRLAGGKVAGAAADESVHICDPGCHQPRPGSVSFKWIVDSIASFTPLDPQRYKVA